MSPMELTKLTLVVVILLAITLLGARRNWPNWALAIFAIPAGVGALWLSWEAFVQLFSGGFRF